MYNFRFSFALLHMEYILPYLAISAFFIVPFAMWVLGALRCSLVGVLFYCFLLLSIPKKSLLVPLLALPNTPAT
jgi:hypothetical protein